MLSLFCFPLVECKSDIISGLFQAYTHTASHSQLAGRRSPASRRGRKDCAVRYLRDACLPGDSHCIFLMWFHDWRASPQRSSSDAHECLRIEDGQMAESYNVEDSRDVGSKDYPIGTGIEAVWLEYIRLKTMNKREKEWRIKVFMQIQIQDRNCIAGQLLISPNYHHSWPLWIRRKWNMEGLDMTLIT